MAKAVTFILISGFSLVVLALIVIGSGIQDDVGIFLLAIPLGLIPAFIARSKGRNFLLWWLYGFAILVIALPHSIVIQDVKTKKCPFCEAICDVESDTCKVCGRDIREA